MTAITELITLRATKLTTQRGLSVGEITSSIIDGSFVQDLREATKWAREAIHVLRSAPDAHYDSDELAARDVLIKFYEKYPNLKGKRSVV